MQILISIVSQIRKRYRFHALVLLVLLGSGSLALLWHTSTGSSVHLLSIYDAAHVLIQDRVAQASDRVGYNVELFTTDTLSGNENTLDAYCRAHVSTSQVGTIVIVIDTRNTHLAIQDNGPVPENAVSFKPSQYLAAKRAFLKTLPEGGWTLATVALLQDLSEAATMNRYLFSLPWRGAMVLDFAFVATLLVLLFLPDRERRREAGGRE